MSTRIYYEMVVGIEDPVEVRANLAGQVALTDYALGQELDARLSDTEDGLFLVVDVPDDEYAAVAVGRAMEVIGAGARRYASVRIGDKVSDEDASTIERRMERFGVEVIHELSRV